jgi:hypothetical protein
VRFEGDGYATQEKVVTVIPGRMTDVGRVRLVVDRGRVTFELATPGAYVTLTDQSGDRREIPRMPLSVNFDGKDRWVVEATKDGYCPFKQPIDFSDGVARKKLRIELQPGCAR